MDSGERCVAMGFILQRHKLLAANLVSRRTSTMKQLKATAATGEWMHSLTVTHDIVLILEFQRRVFSTPSPKTFLSFVPYFPSTSKDPYSLYNWQLLIVDMSCRFDAASSSTPIWLSGLSCSSSDTSLFQCSHDTVGSNYCSHSEDIAVFCLGSE